MLIHHFWKRYLEILSTIYYPPYLLGFSQGIHSIYQLLLFLFHLFSLTLFLLLCFLAFQKLSNENLQKMNQNWNDSVFLVPSLGSVAKQGIRKLAFSQELDLATQHERNGILLPKLFWRTVRKKCSNDREKLLKFWGWRPWICKILEITRTIYSNSESSERFLVTECYLDIPGGFLYL